MKSYEYCKENHCNSSFTKLDLVRIHTGVFDYNLASQKVLEKCGYKKEGALRTP